MDREVVIKEEEAAAEKVMEKETEELVVLLGLAEEVVEVDLVSEVKGVREAGMETEVREVEASKAMEGVTVLEKLEATTEGVTVLGKLVATKVEEEGKVEEARMEAEEGIAE